MLLFNCCHVRKRPDIGVRVGYIKDMDLDPAACYRALATRDGRFDGHFFVGVRTTFIYCRPVCRARTPGQGRCVFYHRAAEAERDGFRACFRCRPELAPGLSSVDAVPRLCTLAVSRIEAGALDQSSLEELAAELQVSSRHLRRAMTTELGVSPVELVQSRRLALARQLLAETDLSMAQVAFASGFSSVRRFNALFQSRCGASPSALRQKRPGDAVGPETGALSLRLYYRPPLDWEALLSFLAARAIPGVEVVRNGTYRRTIWMGRADGKDSVERSGTPFTNDSQQIGWVVVSKDEQRPALRVEISLSLLGTLLPLRARLRALFDLDAEPAAIAEQLCRDPRLVPLLAAHPGLRVPGSFDGFETTARSILGQQVSVRAATTLSGRLVAELGAKVETPHPGLDRLFPRPRDLLFAGEERICRIGLPATRARALLALARAVAEEGLVLSRPADSQRTIERLLALPGIGDWTAHYVAMRVLGWPGAFPAGDLVLRKALGGVSAREAAALAEHWQPFSAYAAVHLWASGTGATAGRRATELSPGANP